MGIGVYVNDTGINKRYYLTTDELSDVWKVAQARLMLRIGVFGQPMNRATTFQQVMKTTFILLVLISTRISMATQTSNWVQSAIQELRRSDEYKHQVIDEWYETLPVAQWNDSGVSVLVRFGRNAMKTPPGSTSAVRIAAAPHLECSIAYPSGGTQWMAFDSTVAPFSVGGDDSAAARPRGDVMALRRSYYQALSNMLDAQSLQKKACTSQRAGLRLGCGGTESFV